MILAAALLVVAVVAFSIMQKFRPQPPKAEPIVVKTTVEALTVRLSDHPVVLPTQGFIEPLTETKAAAEVAGRIISVSPQFRAGGQFQAGDALLEIDPADYQSALAQAESVLADARLSLVNEEARAEQAKRDWKRLAPSETPGPLVLRLPHLASAQAKVKAAEAAVERAKRDFERTILRAPYPGRVKSQRVDLGDYVIPGTQLAELWRSDIFEVRLPVSVNEYSLIDLPAVPKAVLQTTAGANTQWTAKIVRSEGVVDQGTRTVSLVAQLENPSPEPLPGTFLKAGVEGRTLKNVASVPRRALLGPARVVIIDSENKLRLRDVHIAWSNPQRVFIDEGLRESERVCLTALPAVIEGMPVDVLAAPPESQTAVTQTGSIP
jgi:RND family efflux transporter MFP subunit